MLCFSLQPPATKVITSLNPGPAWRNDGKNCLFQGNHEGNHQKKVLQPHHVPLKCLCNGETLD